MAKRASTRKARPRQRKPAKGGAAKDDDGQRREHQSYPIVGMGASAGGLEAFQKFLSRMPADNGMAFILMPHLDARHKSAMAELLQRCTQMPVVEIDAFLPLAGRGPGGERHRGHSVR